MMQPNQANKTWLLLCFYLFKLDKIPHSTLYENYSKQVNLDDFSRGNPDTWFGVYNKVILNS